MEKNLLTPQSFFRLKVRMDILRRCKYVLT
jgi:hypothetical protein